MTNPHKKNHPLNGKPAELDQPPTDDHPVEETPDLIKASQLHNTLAGICAGEVELPACRAVDQIDEELLFDPTMGERLPLRILLTEDNTVNQMLALHLLERMGYRADVATNGLEALDALRQRPYDVVFMDVQMPKMDGMEATRCVRREWPGEQGPRIIAMTSNTLQGDRELCLEAGMDDYISKPIQPEELVAALQQCQPGKHSVEGSQQSAVSSQQSAEEQKSSRPENIQHPAPSAQRPASIPAVLDPAALDKLAELGGGASFLTEMIASFLKDAPQLLTDMRRTLEQRDASGLRRAAHTLKSDSADFGAPTLFEFCKDLEMLAKAGTLEGAEKLAAQIEAEYERVKAALEALQVE